MPRAAPRSPAWATATGGWLSAFKLARQYFIERGEPGPTRFIARRQSYHGNTLGTLAAGGNVARRIPYEPIFADRFSLVSPSFPFHYQQAGKPTRHT
jgi:adenosylmethionine-8-amino-7-oxononanoate aminotransferase